MRNVHFTAPRAASMLVFVINLIFSFNLSSQTSGDPVPLIVIEDVFFLNAATTPIHTKNQAKDKYYTNNTYETETETETPAVISVSTYPNPVVDMLQIEIGDTENELELIELFAANGQRLRAKNTPATQQAQLNMSDLAGGIYYLRVTTTEGITTQTISK